MIIIICEICGKHQVNTKIFKNGNTSDSRKINLMWACQSCAHTFMMNRLKSAAKVLNQLGFKYDRHGWKYSNRLIRKDELIDLGALEHQIKYLKDENRELKRKLKYKDKNRK